MVSKKEVFYSVATAVGVIASVTFIAKALTSPGGPGGAYALTLSVDATSGNTLTYFTFTGSLTNNGVPVSGQPLLLVDQSGATQGTATTATNGTYQIIRGNWATGTYTLYVVATGVLAQSNNVTITVSGSQLSIFESSGTIIGPEPPGVTPQYTVLIDTGATGGVAPYTFKLVWADGVTQTQSGGAFSRGFNATPVTSGTLTVTTADGQTASISVTAPF